MAISHGTALSSRRGIARLARGLIQRRLSFRRSERRRRLQQGKRRRLRRLRRGEPLRTRIRAEPVIAIEFAHDFEHLVDRVEIAVAHGAKGDEHRLTQAADLQLDELMGRINGAPGQNLSSLLGIVSVFQHPWSRRGVEPWSRRRGTPRSEGRCQPAAPSGRSNAARTARTTAGADRASAP